MQPGHVTINRANVVVMFSTTFVWRTAGGYELGRSTVVYNDTTDYYTDPRHFSIVVANLSGPQYTGGGCWYQT